MRGMIIGFLLALGISVPMWCTWVDVVTAAQPADDAIVADDAGGEEVPDPKIGRLFAHYLLGGTRRNIETSVEYSYPNGPNPLMIPKELSQQGLYRYTRDNIVESLTSVQPDAVIFHNPFGAPAGVEHAMAFHQRDMARDLGYLNLANGNDVTRAAKLIRQASGTQELWFYLGAPDDWPALSFNEYVYAVQPLINNSINIWIDSSADEDESSQSWKLAQSIRPWVNVGYEARPEARTPWAATSMPCFAPALFQKLPDGSFEWTGGYFRGDPALAQPVEMAHEDDIKGEIVLHIYNGTGADQIAYGIELMSQGYSVAISGWELHRYHQTAATMKAAARELATHAPAHHAETAPSGID